MHEQSCNVASHDYLFSPYQCAKHVMNTGKHVGFHFFHPFVPFGNLMFGYVSTNQADSLVFLREWHVTPHLFVFSVKAALSFDVLM